MESIYSQITTLKCYSLTLENPTYLIHKAIDYSEMVSIIFLY